MLDAYACVLAPSSPILGTRFFGNGWIDAAVRPGKSPGAFAHPTVPSAHPYLLLNYPGRTRDVMTLAHELGHGVHQILAGAARRLDGGRRPLTLAETASVFGEQLTFRAMLDNEQDPIRRRVMLANKIEDMLNTVIRQVAFCDFERSLHDRRREGELTAERNRRPLDGGPGRQPGPGDPLEATAIAITGPTFRISSTRRFMCMPMPSAIAWSTRSMRSTRTRRRAFRTSISTCCAPAARCATRNCSRRSGSMPAIRRFGAGARRVIETFIDELEAMRLEHTGGDG